MTYRIFLLLFGLFCSSACLAEDYPIGLTIEGKIISGTDTYGAIGLPGDDLSGNLYKLYFGVGGFNGNEFLHYGTYTENKIIGSFGPMLTVKGVTIWSGGYGQFLISKQENGTHLEISQISDFSQIGFWFDSPEAVIPSADLTKRWKYTVRPGDNAGVYWATSHFSPGEYTLGLALNLSINTLVFSGSNTGPYVAEPSTWSMMIVGLGMLGSAMRSRRRVMQMRY